MKTTSLSCPLCTETGSSTHFHQDRYRDYFACPNCYLVYVTAAQFISAEAEKSEYDKHQNSANDSGYRKFLSRLFIPLNDLLAPQSHGLDFGSGPGPVLSAMFAEAGHSMSLYDIFYAPDRDVLGKQYDFISATEVVEHLHDPAKTLAHLWSILKPGGWLGIMTKLVLDEAAFSRWHYKNDPTHICFFSLGTMKWLAAQWQAKLLQCDKDVFLFQKPISAVNNQLPGKN